MSKLRFAVLEDDGVVLDRIVRMLKFLDTVQVITAQEDAAKFTERVRADPPDALLLDIEIDKDEEAGLRIAGEFSLPVLFISGRVAQDLLRIEKLQRLREQLPVEHLSKGFDEFDFKQAIARFIKLIDATTEPTMISLRCVDRTRLPVRLKDIVSIEAPENEQQAANNSRVVFFTNRRPVIVPKLSMTDDALEDEGFPKGSMLRVSKASCINPERVKRYSSNYVWVECVLEDGTRKERKLDVGAAYADAVAARLKGRI